MTIDGTNQTEVWGSFRAGRLAEATLDSARIDGDALDIRAHHTGYRHLPGAPLHRRCWLITPDRIEVTDEVEGTGIHSAGYRLLLDPGQVLRATGAGVECTGRRITVQGPEEARSTARVVPTTYATGHGELREAQAIEGTSPVDLPARLVTTIALDAIG